MTPKNNCANCDRSCMDRRYGLVCDREDLFPDDEDYGLWITYPDETCEEWKIKDDRND